MVNTRHVNELRIIYNLEQSRHRLKLRQTSKRWEGDTQYSFIVPSSKFQEIILFHDQPRW